MSQRSPEDESLKAAWLAKNTPEKGATLPALGTGLMIDELYEHIKHLGVCETPPTPRRLKARKSSIRTREKLKTTSSFVWLE